MIYENIEKLCAKRGISVKALESAAGLGNGTIGKWKNPSYSPSLLSLQKIANALGVTVQTLLRERKE
nr:MAG TPA: Cro/C1-type HTH DNA-binding domain protein [Caudoviricetes sp.]